MLIEFASLSRRASLQVDKMFNGMFLESWMQDGAIIPRLSVRDSDSEFGDSFGMKSKCCNRNDKPPD